MNRQDYRDAFDAVTFSEDFEARTLRKLDAALDPSSEKESCVMRKNRMRKLALLVAAAVVLLAAGVSAAVLWRSPAQVADAMDNPTLAAAFAGEDAVVCNETQVVGDYAVTLLGTVSGRNLSAWGSDLAADHTYVVTALARTDGTPLEAETFDAFSWTTTPLVAGCPVRAVNSWTLDGFAQCQVLDGIAYYILDVQNLQVFADRTVYLAVYQGGTPSPSQFPMAEDGSLSLADPAAGALFTLPLDADLADPAAAAAFLEDLGLGEATS